MNYMENTEWHIFCYFRIFLKYFEEREKKQIRSIQQLTMLFISADLRKISGYNQIE